MSMLASGSSPQYLINEVAHRISTGEVRCAVLSGCEFLHTLAAAGRAGYTVERLVSELGWGDASTGASRPVKVGPKLPTPALEIAHGLALPINT